jgi:hypothetical protein
VDVLGMMRRGELVFTEIRARDYTFTVVGWDAVSADEWWLVLPGEMA